MPCASFVACTIATCRFAACGCCTNPPKPVGYCTGIIEKFGLFCVSRTSIVPTE